MVDWYIHWQFLRFLGYVLRSTTLSSSIFAMTSHFFCLLFLVMANSKLLWFAVCCRVSLSCSWRFYAGVHWFSRLTSSYLAFESFFLVPCMMIDGCCSEVRLDSFVDQWTSTLVTFCLILFFALAAMHVRSMERRWLSPNPASLYYYSDSFASCSSV